MRILPPPSQVMGNMKYIHTIWMTGSPEGLHCMSEHEKPDMQV